MGKPKFYAVAVGKQMGIFTSWGETEAQVKGFSGARYKGFDNEADAKLYLQQNSQSTPTKSKSPPKNIEEAPKPTKKLKLTHTIPSSFAIPENFLSTDQVINVHAIQIYTDGSCIKNPGPGGWACVILFFGEDYEKCLELSGGNPDTTNNQMELLAAIQALEGVYSVIVKSSPTESANSTAIKITCDSQYVKNGVLYVCAILHSKGIEQWIDQWKENDWKTAKKKDVMNQEFWQRLDQIVSNLKTANHKILWSWVKGHSGHHYNERVDVLARAQAEQYLFNNNNNISNENE